MHLSRTIIILAFIFYSSSVYSQDTLRVRPLSEVSPSIVKKDENGQRYYYDFRQRAKIYEIDGETVIVLDEINVGNRPRFNTPQDKNYYYFIDRRLMRVYPLFLKALEQYRDIQDHLKTMEGRERKAYTRARQADLAAQYEGQLRQLTTTEGRLFAKLMNRATGKTVYEIIKELRGGWSAFWWNVKGNIAEVDIKKQYDPHSDRTDLFLESLLISHWERGSLEPYFGAENFQMKK